MINVQVRLDSIEKVKQFSSIIAHVNPECEIVEGVHIVDAKSIMGIFSMDLTKPVQLRIHSDDRSILNQLKDFLVDPS